jgi:hypothetical protein
MVTPSFVKIVGSQFAIGCMTGEHVKRTDDEGIGDGHDRPFSPAPIRPASAIVWVGARHRRVVTTAGRAPVRPATRGRRVVARAAARVIAGRINA